MLLPSTSFSSRYRLVDERHDDTAVRRRCADHGDAREVEKRLHVVASRKKEAHAPLLPLPGVFLGFGKRHYHRQ
jgi:hypothetical protein